MRKLYALGLYILLIFLVASASGQSDTKDEYIVDNLSLKSKVFHNTRTIRILLPPGYFEPKNKAVAYPVLYLNDGIAQFHAYNLKQTVHQLINKGLIKPTIIVGIDNGGSTTESKNAMRDRANEYLPWSDFAETNSELKLANPKGSLYPSFLVNEVMPLVKNHFRIKAGAENTGLGGSSYGALIALYTAIKRPGVFGMLLLESPSLYVHDERILKNALNCKSWPQKVYIGVGTKEGTNSGEMVDNARVLNNIVKRSAKVDFVTEVGAEHNYQYFAKRFPEAIKFLLN